MNEDNDSKPDILELAKILDSEDMIGFTRAFVKDFQKGQPISYGLASIILALGLGVGAAMVRHFFSRIKKKAEQA